MPNHVKNILKIKINNNKVEDILNRFKTKDSEFDFNTIIPMPNNIFKGDLGEKERKLYGELNWYDWSIENWGTKWNAYEILTIVEKKYITYIFETAWSMPLPIYEKLAEEYDFTVRYADEDIGNNCGKYYAINGSLYEKAPCQDMKAFANRVWDY